MRALCGAIIAAGAMIGLGLTAIGIGERYSRDMPHRENGDPFMLHLGKMDTPLIFVLVFLTAAAVIGIGIAFVGLAYHHHRRERELHLAAGGNRHSPILTPGQ